MSEFREKINGGVNTLNIAFLACDKIPEEAQEAHGEYADVLHNLFEPLIPKDMNYNTHAFDVVHKREYPTDSDLENIDALVISGSFEDDADHDVTWILRLAGFLIKVHDDFPRIRILGICFGLQILARAFGPSPIVKNEKGWEVGSTKVELTEMGRRIVWGHNEEGTDRDDDKDYVMMQQIHSDIVHECPEGFELLGSSEKTPVQGIAKFYNSSEPIPAFTHTKGGKSPESFWQSIHIIAFQGHPEWHEDILIPLVDNYEKDGVFDKEYADEARKAVKQHHDGQRIGKVLLKVLGIL